MSVFFLYVAIVIMLSLLAVAGMLWLRKRISGEALRRNHEVAGFVYSVVGAIFAVTVALMVDTVHDEYIASERYAASEAIAASTIYNLADWFPESGGKALQQNLRDYVNAVVGPEWAGMARAVHRPAPEAETALLAVSATLKSIKPDTAAQQAAYNEMLQRYTQLREYRYTRLFGKRYDLPFPIWFSVIFGGLVTIGFTLFFSMQSTRAQALLIFFVSAMIWSNILIISEVQYPFNGINITPPRAMLQLQHRF